jgi:hypothetical protein
MWDDESHSGFYTAAVCSRGHMVAADVGTHAHRSQSFVPSAGQRSFWFAKLQGQRPRPLRFAWIDCGGGNYPDPPKFCFSCGQPFPWTVEKLEAAKRLADALDEVSPSDREKLKMALGDVAAAGPRAEAAAARIKKLIRKAGSASVKLSGK